MDQLVQQTVDAIKECRWSTSITKQHQLSHGYNGRTIDIIHLQYLSSVNVILGVTSENGIILFDASNGEILQNFKTRDDIVHNLLFCYHNCTGSIILSDGFSLGYRCQLDGIFLMKTILQLPIASAKSIVALELPLFEAKILAEVIKSEALSAGDLTLDESKDRNSSDIKCFRDMHDVLEKEINSHCCSGKMSLTSKWASLQLLVQCSTIKAVCHNLLNCYRMKQVQEMLMENSEQHHLLHALTITSSISHQLSLLWPEEKNDDSQLFRSEMYSEMSRRQSFAIWPHPDYKYAHAAAMAEAGFFHHPTATGDDRAICFACNVCLVCWEPMDEPWSEHERHSPSCPFVLSKLTLNVPIAVTCATQPAAANPLLQYLGDQCKELDDVKLDFLSAGQNCSFVVAASKRGDFVTWDALNRIPTLWNISTINKFSVFRQLQKHMETLGNFDSKDLDLTDLTVTSMCVLDSIHVADGVSLDMSASVPLSSPEGKSKQNDKNQSTNSTGVPSRLLDSKYPVLVIGAVVKVAPKPTQQMQDASFFSLLIFTSCDTNSSSNDETDALYSESPNPLTVQLCPFDSEGELTNESWANGEQFHEGTNEDMLSEFEDSSLLETNFNDSIKAGGNWRGKIGKSTILQVVIIDHRKNEQITGQSKLQVVRHLMVTENSGKIILTTSPEDCASGKLLSGHPNPEGMTVENFSTEAANCSKTPSDDTKDPGTCRGTENYGRVIVMDIMLSQSSQFVAPTVVSDTDEGKYWIAIPESLQILEVPCTFSTGNEADVDGDFNDQITDTTSNCDPDVVNSTSEQSLILSLGNDGILRLLDLDHMKIVHEMKSDTKCKAIEDKLTAFTYCTNLDQVCAATETGNLLFIKVERHLGTYTSVDKECVNSHTQIQGLESKRKLVKEEDLIASQPLTPSNLLSLMQLTTFEPLEPRFNVKHPPNWVEVQLQELVNIGTTATSSSEDTGTTIPRKFNSCQCDGPVQMTPQRRHLRHPNEYYDFTAHCHTRAWKMHHDCIGEEIFELLFPRIANLSHIDLKFVLSDELKNGSDIKVTLLKSRRNSKVSTMEKEDDPTHKSAATKLCVDDIDTVYSRVKHLLTEHFVDKLMEENVESPVLLVVGTTKDEDHDIKYTLMDGNKKTVIATCKDTPTELAFGCVVEVNGYVSAEEGSTNFILMAESLTVCAEESSLPDGLNGSDDIIKEEDCGHERNSDERQSTPGSNKSSESSTGSASDRSDVLFGPVPLSNYIDATGIGGVVTIASESITIDSRHRPVILLIENITNSDGTGTKEDGHLSEFKTGSKIPQRRNYLQEVSITVFKCKPVNVKHERLQRSNILSSKSLHARLLSSLCHKSTSTGYFVCEFLPQKLMALDILNWVCDLQSVPVHAGTSNANNSPTTTADSRSPSQYQSLAYLLCFFDQSKDSVMGCSGSNSTDIEFSLENFLVSCFLESERDVAIRALRLIFNTVLSMDVQFENISGKEILFDAVINCLKYAVQTSVKSTYGMQCLYKVLTILLDADACHLSDKPGKFQVRLQECVHILETASSLMKKSIHPTDVVLRSKYGLYISPFHPATYVSEVNCLKNSYFTDHSNADCESSPKLSRDLYFSEEELNVYEFATLQKFNPSEVMSLCDIREDLDSSQFSLIECQPLHFDCVQCSDGCSYYGMRITGDDVVLKKISLCDILKAHPEISDQDFKLTSADYGKHKSKMPEYDENVNDILELYTDLDTCASVIKQHYNTQMEDRNLQSQQETGKEQSATLPDSPLQKGDGSPCNDTSYNVNYHIPMLSFVPPSYSHLTISRMHSGARRSVVLDFHHVVELTDIHIPVCIDLSFIIVDALPIGRDEPPSVDDKGFYNIATSLDIRQHNLVLTNLTPSILTRYIRITVTGRYGTSNPQTVVNLGHYYGRPTCVRVRHPIESQHEISSAGKCNTDSPKDVNKKQEKLEISSYKFTDPIVETNGKYALEKYLRSLQNYCENLNCRFQLACFELKSYISNFNSNFNHWMGNPKEPAKDEDVHQAYAKCIGIQVQKSSVEHAINHVESICHVSQTEFAKQSSTCSQLEIHCKLMLNVLLSIRHAKYGTLALQGSGGNIFSLSCAQWIFENLIYYSNPGIRIRATGVLLSCCAIYPWWSSFLTYCLTEYVSTRDPENACLSHNHLFSTLLVLGQRSLAVPGKGEEIIESLLNLISKMLPLHDINLPNIEVVTLAIQLASQLVDSILHMNKSLLKQTHPVVMSKLFMDKADVPKNSPDPSPLLQSTQKSGSVFHILPQHLNPAAPHMWFPQSSANVPSSIGSQDLCMKSQVSPASHWDFITLSKFQTTELKHSDSIPEILKWLQALRVKLQTQRTGLIQLGKQERSLLLRMGVGSEDQVAKDHGSDEAELAEVHAKAKEHFKVILSYRRTLDKKAMNSLLRYSQSLNKKSKRSDDFLQSLSFRKISMELCRNVVKQILGLLFHHESAMLEDFVVLSCKFCSQLSQWASLQCIHDNCCDTSNENNSEPLSLSDLLSPTQIKTFLLLSSGKSVLINEINSSATIFSYPAEPWKHHAMKNLLHDLLKFENDSICSFYSLQPSSMRVDNDELSGDAGALSNQGTIEKPVTPPKQDTTSQMDPDQTDSKKDENLYESQIKLADNFIDVCDTYIAEVSNLVMSQALLEEASSDTKRPFSEYNELNAAGGECIFDIQHHEAAAQWNETECQNASSFSNFLRDPSCRPIRLREDKRLIFSHTCDSRPQLGIGRKFELTLKLCNMTSSALIAESLRIPPSTSLREECDSGDVVEAQIIPKSSFDHLKTSNALKSSINHILDCFQSYRVSFPSLCQTILLIQESYDCLSVECQASAMRHQLILGPTELKKLLNISSSLSLLFHIDNLRTWNILLTLLNSLLRDSCTSMMKNAMDHRTFLNPEFGLLNFITQILTANLSASGISLAQFHESLPVLGPSICAQLEKLFRLLHEVASKTVNCDGSDNIRDDQTFSLEDLRDFYLSIMESLVRSSAFNHYSETPTDGQCVFVRATMKICVETGSPKIFTGDPRCLTIIASGTVSSALAYLSWCKNNIRRNAHSGIEPLESYSDSSSFLSKSSKGEVLLQLLKLVTALSQGEDGSEFQPMSDVIFRDEAIIESLLSAVAISNGSLTISQYSCLLNTTKIARTTSDGVHLLLSSLFRSATDASVKILPLMKYLQAMGDLQIGPEKHEPALTTRSMSYPFFLFIVHVFDSPGKLVDALLTKGGLRLIIVNFLASARKGFHSAPGPASQIMHYLKAASDRAAATTAKPSVPLQNEANWSIMKGSKPSGKGNNFGYSLSQVETMVKKVSTMRRSICRGQEKEDFNFATVASVECSDATAPPADSLLKPKPIQRRARAPVWSYQFPAYVEWMSLTLHFPNAFLLKCVKILPVLLNLSTSPSAIILEVSQSGTESETTYRPLSATQVTTGTCDITFAPSVEEVVSSLRIFFKKPVDSCTMGLTRISVHGASFMSNKAQNLASSSRNEIVSKTPLSLWVLLLQHFVCIDDTDVTQKVNEAVSTFPGLVRSLCSLLERTTSSQVSSAIEVILLRLADVVEPTELVDCLLRSQCRSRSLGFLAEPSASDSSDHFSYLIYELCKKDDSKRGLRLKKILDWILECSQEAVNNPRSEIINTTQVHAIACGLWQCSNADSIEQEYMELVARAVYDWARITKNRSCDFPYIHSSPRLREALNWLLCSFCKLDGKVYSAVLHWMGDLSICNRFMYGDSKVIIMTNNDIETLALVSQTESAIHALLDQEIVHLFANGVEKFCCSLLPPSICAALKEDVGMIEVTAKNIVLIIKFFSNLCNIRAVQYWLGSKEGSDWWHVLIKTVDHFTHKRTCRDMAASPLPNSLLPALQESTVYLLKQISRCNHRNKRVVASAICSTISAHCENPERRAVFSGFVQTLLLEVIMVDETVTVHIKCECDRKMLRTAVSQIGGGSLRHPMFETGHFNCVLEVSMNSSIKNVSSIMTGERPAPAKPKMDSPPTKDSYDICTNKAYAKYSYLIPSSIINDDELAYVKNAGQNAREKRSKKAVDPTSSTEYHPLPTVSEISFTCNDLKTARLDPNVSFLQIMDAYEAHEDSFFYEAHEDSFFYKPREDSFFYKAHEDLFFYNRVKLETCPNSSMTSEENGNTKETLCSISDGVFQRKKFKTILEVFADVGGLSLVARHLPSLTLVPGPGLQSDSSNTMQADEQRFNITQTSSYLDFSSEWLSLDSEDYSCSPMSEPHFTHFEQNGKQIPMDFHYEVTQPATSGTRLSSTKSSLPSFTLLALRSFVRLPFFAEELLKDCNAARCLLRISLGVTDDGNGQFIPGLALTQSLALLPFHALCRLLNHCDCAKPSGLVIREAMTFQTSAIRLVLACISRFSNIKTSKDFESGKWQSPVSEDFSAAAHPKKPTRANEKNYWARGTGFGTGSTSSDWNPGDMKKKQMIEEGYLTVFLKVLANFVCPVSNIPAESVEEAIKQDEMKCFPPDGKVANALSELITEFGILSAIALYLRNDSVLDMSSHVPLYCSLLSVIRSFSLCPSLRQLLISPSHDTQHECNIQEDKTQHSIFRLIKILKKCVDTYSNRLDAIDSDLDAHGEEGFSSFVRDVQRTDAMLRAILQGSDNIPQQRNSSVNEIPSEVSSVESSERVYMEKMKELQFDTSALVQECKNGDYILPSGHHYGTHIKEARNVADASRARRLAQEAVTLSNSLPLSLSSTVFVRCDEERLDVMKVLITGPQDTPYSNGCFEFDVFFPGDYNKSPPLINLRTTGNHTIRFNPNLYNDGKVCLSILNTWHGRPEERWNPQTSSFLQILVSIQSLILVNEPYFNEPGYERSRGTPAGEQCSREYDANIQQATVKWAMLEQLRNPSRCFKEIIQNHFWIKRKEILKQCDDWLAEMKKHAKQQKNRKSIAKSYSSLQKHVSLLKAKLENMECPESPDENE